MKRVPKKKPAAPAKISVRDLSGDLKRVKRLVAAAKLAGVEEGLSYGQPSLKAGGTFLARVREPDVLVLRCALEEKDILMQINPDVYFETDHYKGWPAVLIRLSKIDDVELTHRLRIACQMQASKKAAKPRPRAKRK